MIDISIDKVTIEITENAIRQICLIRENDYTLDNQVFRLKIDGKGCQGFDYAIGFADQHVDDLVLNVQKPDHQASLHLDPFTAYYCSEGTIDYIQDFEHDTEGFHFENKNEKQYRGKFFKNESKTPKMKS